MKIALCTLVLNEMEWLPQLYEQHKDWPGLSRWVFVESADRVYAQVNPTWVTKDGLSVDGTQQFLQKLASSDHRVDYIPFGFSSSPNAAQGKCESRSQYLASLEEVKPDFFFVLDADEFYPKAYQQQINDMMRMYSRSHGGYCFKHRHPWRPPSVEHDPLFTYEVEGGFWDIPLCRGWRWSPGLTYSRNHNTPQMPNGMMLDHRLKRIDQRPGTPYCVHMAFSSDVGIRHAKHQYYAARGESTDPKRSWYVDSRAAFETWQPGDKLPRGARIMFYDGEVPECFRQ